MAELKVGDVLKPVDSNAGAIQLVGIQGPEWVCAAADESFATPRRISAVELRQLYSVDGPSVPVYDDLAEMHARDRRANDEAVQAYAESHPEWHKARRREERMRAFGANPNAEPAPGSPEDGFRRQAERDNGTDAG